MMETAPPTAPTEELFHFAVFCPVERNLLRILRRFVTSVAEEMGFAEEDVIKIELAVDEACSNIARHAYAQHERAENHIELKLRMEPEALVIQARDRGKGAGAGQELRGAASIEDYCCPDRDRFDGLGLLIIRQFMDEVHVESHPGLGTTVLMRKRLRQRRGPDAGTDQPGDFRPSNSLAG